MALSWQKLTELTRGAPFEIEKVRLTESSILIEGPFDLPPLAKLPMDDLVFITGFIRTHGSIKEMEQLFGVSYPTIKNRLNRIAEQLEFVEVKNSPITSPSRHKILEDLEAGKITAKQALAKLKEIK